MPNTSFALYFILALCISSSTSLASETDNCDSYGGDHLGQVQCLNRGVKKLDEELNNIYKAALAELPEKHTEDSRKEREQLRKSQRAWLKYKDENCILIGGMEGGSNLWVTHFIARCEAKAIIERIKFLKDIADGAFKN